MSRGQPTFNIKLLFLFLFFCSFNFTYLLEEFLLILRWIMVHLPFLLMLVSVQYTLYMELDVQELLSSYGWLLCFSRMIPLQQLASKRYGILLCFRFSLVMPVPKYENKISFFTIQF